MLLLLLMLTFDHSVPTACKPHLHFYLANFYLSIRSQCGFLEEAFPDTHPKTDNKLAIAMQCDKYQDRASEKGLLSAQHRA